jgi:DNA-binding LacI/PurR family transcriptional regulator
LTTIKLPVHQLAEEAVKNLLSRIENPDKASRTVMMEVHLENRASTGPLKIY